MRWDSLRVVLAAAAALAAGGCDQLGLGPQQAASSPSPTPAPAPAPFDGGALRAQAGAGYATFVAEAGAQYAPEAMGLAVTDRTRLWRGMALPQAGELLSGGGAEALVFRGCAETGCAEGLSVVAIDTANGGVFAAVRDVGGADILASNERVEALLRLNSPSRSWDNPPATPPTATP